MDDSFQGHEQKECSATEGSNLPLWKSENFEYQQGARLSAMINGKRIRVAGPNYFKQHHKPLPAIPAEADQQAETVNFLMIDDEVAGIVTLISSSNSSSCRYSLSKVYLKPCIRAKTV